MFIINRALCSTALAMCMAVPAHAAIVDGRLTSLDQYDWVFDVPVTTTDKERVTAVSQLYVKSTVDKFFMYYSVPLALKDMTWTKDKSDCCTHDSWTKQQDQKDVVHSEYFRFTIGGQLVGMDQDRSSKGGEPTSSPAWSDGKTTFEWLTSQDTGGIYTSASDKKDVSSPILAQDGGGNDLYEVAPGQTGDPDTWWVFDMGYEFELIRAELPTYDPDAAASILALMSNFEYHLSPYKNGEKTTLDTPCIEANDCTFTNLRVSEVPLPAAGWLLLAGVGALGAIRRRVR